MKFCPNCGNDLFGKTSCDCGYDINKTDTEKQIINPGVVYIDEMCADYLKNPTSMKTNEIYANKVELKKNICNYITNETIDLEDFIITQYQKSPLEKEEFIKILNDVLDLKVENIIQECINKIKD